ncbi:MAG: glycoside hydrolase family 15 protein [Candidatus Binataceae bacterium]|nr:glycoside hydrolase family 15 protein [Candidatus Binataceae bacterium]
MNLRIEDYALIGNMHTAALVGRDGSIDWLCVPRFDSSACFAALLGGPEHGRWLIAPEGKVKAVRRNYRGETLILETIFETDDGMAALIDFMPVKEQAGQVDIVRLVEGREGSVTMRMELVIRFDYGEVVPWIRRTGDGVRAIGGPDAILLHTPVETHGEDLKTVARFTVSKGETMPFTLIRNDARLPAPQVDDPMRQRDQDEAWWKKWVSNCGYDGPHREAVIRSLITLKALTYNPTGAIVAAPTTSLPEQLQGPLNWDYRYCWLRDATFTLTALLIAGYTDEALAWRDWLMRAVAGQADKLQIMYGLAGERRLKEFELSHLPGYEGSKPVRVGNAAHGQFQLDVYGEIMNALSIAHRYQIKIDDDAWRMHCVFLTFLEGAWQKPDDGMWEVRTGARHFTESKVACWVAFDRAVKLIEKDGLKGPLEKWRATRDKIHADVCAHGFDTKRNTFVQYYGASDLDASLLRLPLMGFLPANDSRMVGTVEAIQRDLMKGGLVKRYSKAMGGGQEGAFLPCTFWLVDCLVAMGRSDEARKIYERLLGLCNDVGLLSEEYDHSEGRMLGNFPQALTHVALINSTFNLFHPQKPLNVARPE